MVAKPSVLNSLIGVVSSGGHSNGSLPAIVDLIACSSVCTCCTLGMNELLGSLSVSVSDISSVGGPWLAIGSLSWCGSSKFSSVSGIPSIGRCCIESKSISMSV